MQKQINPIHSKLLSLLLIMLLLLPIACTASDEPATSPSNSEINQNAAATEPVENNQASETAESDEIEATATATTTNNSAVIQDAATIEPVEMATNLDSWLQQVNAGEISSEKIEETLDWSLGYFLYYGTLESSAIDTLIYNALLVHRRLDIGEVTQETLPQKWQNLLAITEGLEYNPDTQVIEQIGQTQEIRETILERVTESQQTLSPEEALASNEVIGFFGPPAPESIGSKYLVYTQETPGADFAFLGVIIAVDAATHGSDQVYSVGDWEELPWLGDAAGPFWEDLPTVSGDRTSTSEGRPGVLLISDETYAEIKAQNSQ